MKYSKTAFKKFILVSKNGDIEHFVSSFKEADVKKSDNTEWCLIPSAFEFQASILGIKIQESRYA
jgi:hypothetical protein